MLWKSWRFSQASYLDVRCHLCLSNTGLIQFGEVGFPTVCSLVRHKTIASYQRWGAANLTTNEVRKNLPGKFILALCFFDNVYIGSHGPFNFCCFIPAFWVFSIINSVIKEEINICGSCRRRHTMSKGT